MGERQLVAMVVYGTMVSPRSLDLLLRCPRCEGSTYDRTNRRYRCPLCTGTPTPGRHAAGWAYLVPGDLDGGPPAPGDVVEVPPTPYTGEANARGTVVELREHGHQLARRSILTVVQRRGWPAPDPQPLAGGT